MCENTNGSLAKRWTTTFLNADKETDKHDFIKKMSKIYLQEMYAKEAKGRARRLAEECQEKAVETNLKKSEEKENQVATKVNNASCLCSIC